MISLYIDDSGRYLFIHFITRDITIVKFEPKENNHIWQPIVEFGPQTVHYLGSFTGTNGLKDDIIRNMYFFFKETALPEIKNKYSEATYNFRWILIAGKNFGSALVEYANIPF